VRLCMFSPLGQPLERGWPGRIDGDRVVQLAAQTLQAFLVAGGRAREHADFALEDVRLLAPVLHPPAVRVFDARDRFEFANPAAIAGPEATVQAPDRVEVLARVAAVLGAKGAIGGFTLLADCRAPELDPPKDRDFALLSGPFVVTPDEAPGGDFDWPAAVALAARGTHLRPGDLIAAPAHEVVRPRGPFELAVEGLGVLRGTVAAHGA
jgi:hypothetical protein